MQLESKTNDTDIFSGCGNGTLDVNIQHDLDPSSGNWDESKGDRHLHICINDDDLLSIETEMFHFVVGIPSEVEDYVYKNWKDKAAQVIAAFPMLNRFDGMYADVLYEAHEVSSLREECVKLKTFTINKSADLGLRKLIYCCDEAIKAGIGIAMWCD